jgi:hypothetical protein
MNGDLLFKLDPTFRLGRFPRQVRRYSPGQRLPARCVRRGR